MDVSILLSIFLFYISRMLYF